jgi:hypothetical protein
MVARGTDLGYSAPGCPRQLSDRRWRAWCAACAAMQRSLAPHCKRRRSANERGAAARSTACNPAGALRAERWSRRLFAEIGAARHQLQQHPLKPSSAGSIGQGHGVVVADAQEAFKNILKCAAYAGSLTSSSVRSPHRALTKPARRRVDR